MKVSYNWLKEYVPDMTQSPEEISELLTLHSFETVIEKKIVIDPAIRVVRITAIEKHPNADKLRLVTITDGTEDIRVVCGAHNIHEGDIVPYAPPGTTVRDDKGEPFAIQEAVIRGEKSPGMLNSLRELGLGMDHSGIYLLPSDTPIGSSLAEHIPNDTLLDADITPNRAHDCMGHLGIAREIAALQNLSVKDPVMEVLPEKSMQEYTISVQEDTRTARYMAILLEDIRQTTSPLWMQARLLTVGMRPISALVDISNYVMLEVGNPSHVFDADKLPGKDISVRFAQEGESIALLDDTSPDLSNSIPVISSNNTPIALAGIMGGKGTEVGEHTNRGLLEIASFGAYEIQTASVHLSSRTEASTRFAKGLDPHAVEIAAKRLMYLFKKYVGAHVEGVLDYYPHARTARNVSFRPDRVSNVAGIDIKKEQIQDVLERLRFRVDDSTVPWSVVIPTDRMDIEGEHDLVEEVIRVIGLSSIPSHIPDVWVSSDISPAIYWQDVVRDMLMEWGMTESYNYSFEPEDMARLLGIEDEGHVVVKNPVDPNMKYLRTSLLPGLLKNMVKNKEDMHKKMSGQEKALFEIGHVYRSGEEGRVLGVVEETRVAGMLVGSVQDAEHIVDSIIERFQLNTREGIVLRLEELGVDVLREIKYRVPVTLFELSFDTLLRHAPQEAYSAYSLEDIRKERVDIPMYEYVSRYPSVLRDISILVLPDVSVNQVQDIIEREGGELVIDTDLFDEYIPEEGDMKGLAFRIEYNSSHRTLTDAEVADVHQQITDALRSELGAKVR